MPKYEIKTPQGTFEVTAPDEQSALDALAADGLDRMGAGEDVARSAATGVREGVEGVAGQLGDVGQRSGGIWEQGARKLGLGEDAVRLVGSLGRVFSPIGPLGGAPSTEEVRSATTPAVEAAGMQDVLAHEPQTRAGKYARTTGQFLPAAATPGSLLRRTAMVALPAGASETAGQITEGTEAEPYARLLAGLAAGAPAALAGRQPVGSLLNKAVAGATRQQIDDTERLFIEAQRRGVPITRAEAIQQVTNGATRMGDMQRVLEGRGELREFFAGRPEQLSRATRSEMDSITPMTGQPSQIGPAAGRAAEGMVNDTREAINRATEPFYTRSAPARVSAAELRRLQATPGWDEASAAIRSDPQLARYVQGMPDDSVGFLNEVQKYLRTQGENAAGAVNAQRNQQRAAGYGSDATVVRTAAERASPEFAHAVREQARLREQYLDPLMQGPLGKLAERDITTQRAIEALFPESPLAQSTGEVSGAVAALARRNPWAAQQLVRAHIERTFNEASRALQGGANQFGGASFYARLMGNPQAARNVEYAVRALPSGDTIWEGFRRYLDVLQATGTRQRIGSNTSFNTEMMQDMGRGTALEGAGKLAAGGFVAWPRKALETVENWRLGRNSRQLAQLIVDPRSRQLFRRLATERNSATGARLALSLTLISNSVDGREKRRVGQRVPALAAPQ
jgi:hypothetical protein